MEKKLEGLRDGGQQVSREELDEAVKGRDNAVREWRKRKRMVLFYSFWNLLIFKIWKI